MFPAALVSASASLGQPRSPLVRRCSDQWLPRLLPFILTPTSHQPNQPASGSHQDVILMLTIFVDVHIVQIAISDHRVSKERVYCQQETLKQYYLEFHFHFYISCLFPFVFVRYTVHTDDESSYIFNINECDEQKDDLLVLAGSPTKSD